MAKILIKRVSSNDPIKRDRNDAPTVDDEVSEDTEEVTSEVPEDNSEPEHSDNDVQVEEALGSQGSVASSQGEGKGTGEGNKNTPKYAHRSVGKVVTAYMKKTRKDVLDMSKELNSMYELVINSAGRSNDDNSSVISVQQAGAPRVLKRVKGVQKEFKKILELAVARENTYLYGPTGSGKTYLAEKVAEVLELPFMAQSVSMGMDETVVTGRILPGNDGWSYKKSTFVDMYENGGVYVFDEFDKADPNLLTFLNTAISNNFFFNELDGGRRINRHEDFILIATANTVGHGGSNAYFGEELDLSTLRRFQTGMVCVGYDKRLEKKLVSPTVYLWGEVMRKVIDKLSIERLVVSTGYLLKIDKMVSKFGWGKKRWEESFFAGRNKDEVKRITSAFQKEVALLEERAGA